MMKKKLLLCSLLIMHFSSFCCYSENFPFKPPENFILDPQSIVSKHPVKTNSLLAQLYFDQGLTLIYAFNHDAAYWSFFRASEMDPNMAMAYWGMALALGSNINMEATQPRLKQAHELINKALNLVENSPENEKDYVKALAQRYSQDPKVDQKKLAMDYKQAMAQLSEKYKDDLDASTLYAESLLDINPWNQWTIQGNPREGTQEAVDVLVSVLKKNPNHLGANHYYIHTIEASKHPERALASADRLKSLMPNSGHILHMPAHIYILTGDYHRAAQANEEAIVADREYIRKYGTGGIYPIHYLSHNLYFLSRAYTMEGRFADAKRAADELFDLYEPHYEHMPELEYFAPTTMFVLLRFHKWEDVLKLPKPKVQMKVYNVLWHFARAVSYANLGQIDQAKQEIKHFEDSRSQLSDDLIYGYNYMKAILSIAQFSMEGELAFNQKDFPKAISSLKKAIAIQDDLRYNEPPDWFFPIRERLGGILLLMKNYEEAEIVFRDDLEKHPRNGRALFGLRESLAGQNKKIGYYWIDQQFQEAWKYSPESLTIEQL